MSLDYDVANHVHCDLRLDSGRVISLRSLEQDLTYAGLLEGAPTKRTNDAKIDAALRVPSSRPLKTVLLPPERRDYLRRPGDMADVHHPFGAPEWLPMVRVVAVFRSLGTGSHPTRISSLRVVWFQDEFALPIGASALKHLQAVEWDLLATVEAPDAEPALSPLRPWWRRLFSR